MSESYAVSEKRELLLDKVKKFILDNGGIVKKSQLAGLGIDYRRILDFVEKGDILRVKSGYYAVHLSDFTEDTSGRDAVGDIGSLPAGMYWTDTEHCAGKHAGLL